MTTRRLTALLLLFVLLPLLPLAEEAPLDPGFPPLTPEGFLPPGQEEFVFIDAVHGKWRFVNQDLRIEITRHEDKSIPLRWLGAEIFTRAGTPGFKMVSHDREHMLESRSRYTEKPAVIARNNGLVFSMDGDYFLYRVHAAKTNKRKLAIGVVIRDREVLVDNPASEKRNLYPPLDMLALFPDGDMRVYKAREQTAQELLDLGAVDVLSFGPWLVRDGQLNDTYSTYGTTIQPRAAIGMVEKGHYWAVIVEGRTRLSAGMTTFEVGELMRDLGCTLAFNLDGGWTSAMVFMGKQLNQLDRTGVHDNARPQNEVMGIGRTTAFEEGRAP
ncbi:MAG: phosphodiester glycosidase family protein [Clostridiales bacterium]|nr:phosphodiester glycosidase family protein [Clostridiales bacterium]